MKEFLIRIVTDSAPMIEIREVVPINDGCDQEPPAKRGRPKKTDKNALDLTPSPTDDLNTDQR
jgi:hypothetical protein